MKLISISLSPNVFVEDIKAAKKMLTRPLQWVNGTSIKEFRDALAHYMRIRPEQVFLFNSGRSSLFALLQAFGVAKDDEVLLQAFTCNAVANPILWLEAKPVYVDVKEDTYNMDVKDLERKITAKSKFIIVQHTFGLAADMDAILSSAKKHKLVVIEDCAHALGATYSCNVKHETCNIKGSASRRKVGTLGDGAFFSFGRDKVISSVYGGAAIINRKSKILNLKSVHDALPYPSERWIKQQLRHPVVMAKLLPLYNIPFNNYGIGKFLLQLAQVSRYLSKAVHIREKQGKKPGYFPARMPNALAYLGLTQFKRLDKFNKHRRGLAKFYYESLRNDSRFTIHDSRSGHIYLRYPIRHSKADFIIQQAKQQGVLLGDWYQCVVAPDDTSLSAMRYIQGSCPVAEKLAHEVFNLPTNPNLSLEDAKKIVNVIRTIKE
jgi:perosamine synthetase